MEDDNKSGWEYKPDGGTAATGQADDAPTSSSRGAHHAKNVSWEAPEFIEHHHGAGWYTALCLTTVVLAAIIYLLSSRDLFASVTVIALGVIVGIFSSYKPGIAQYEITSNGLTINGKLYKYGDYKSFSIISEGQLSSLNLLPLKRFMPPVSAYFDPANEKKIMDAAGNHLPYEDRRLDAIERLSRRLRL